MPENVGHVIQIAGPAVDVQFAEGHLPPIYPALKVVSDGFNVPSPIAIFVPSSVRQTSTAKAACAQSPWKPPTAWCVG